MFDGITHWHWFILALVIGGVEVMTMSMYLAGPAGAAAIVGLVKLIFPQIGLGASLILFAVSYTHLTLPTIYSV